MARTLLSRFGTAIAAFVYDEPAPPKPTLTVVPPTPEPALERRLGELLDEYWSSHWSSLDTHRQVESVLTHYLRPSATGENGKPGRGLAELRLNELTITRIAAWHTLHKAKHRMANRALQLARQAWRALEPERFNPFERVKIHPERPRKRRLSDNERDRFKSSLGELRGRRGGVTPVVADAIWTLRSTGGRKMEILGLRVDQVDLVARKIVLDEHKTDDKVGAREIHLGAAYEVVRNRCEASRRSGTSYVFPGHGKTGHLVAVSAAFKKILRHAGIVESKDLVLHSLRGDFASQETDTGAALNVVQASLGHADPSTTARYALASSDKVKQAVDHVAAKQGAQPWSYGGAT